MKNLNCFRHYQKLVKQAKNRHLYLDWEKIDRTEDYLRQKALEEIKTKDLEEIKITESPLSLLEQPKRSLKRKLRSVFSPFRNLFLNLVP